jgi:hypothetical protein
VQFLTEPQSRKTMATSWNEIMRELAGRRLAVLDAVLRDECVDTADPKVQNALGWLAFHRFVYRTSDGKLRGRRGAEAQQVFQTEGAAADAGRIAESRELSVESRTAAQQVPVQPHQVQFFAMEGYRS